MTELLVVVVIMALIGSMLMPTFAQGRRSAREVQCRSQMRQISQALVMYDMDHDQTMENMPDRLTHLNSLQYCNDERVFVCPMDSTLALGTTLKPGKAKDDKGDWRERASNPPMIDGNGTRLVENNCSYLYEFSTRVCQRWDYNDGDPVWITDGTSSTFCSDFLGYWDGWYDPAFPEFVGFGDGILSDLVVDANEDGNFSQDEIYSGMAFDRNGDGIVTWQEAKFWQLNNGDAFITGYGGPGSYGIPEAWTWDPYDQIGFTATAQQGYARTWLPVVRCFWHMNPGLVDDERTEQVLNLALDGNTFMSVPGWEQTAWWRGRSWQSEDEPPPPDEEEEEEP